MKLFDKRERTKDVAEHVFSGSTTMIGVCITVIALFKVMKTSMRTYADEFLGIDTFIFITSTLLSYTSLRNGSKRVENIADIFFFTGMLIMLLVGFMIVFTTY